MGYEVLVSWSGIQTVVLAAIFSGLTAYVIYATVRKSNLSKLIVSACLILLTLNGYSEYRLLNVQFLGTETSRQFSGNDQSYVECQRFSEAFFDARTVIKGLVDPSQPDRAYLKYSICKSLESLYRSPTGSHTLEESVALAVLLHEAIHTSGELTESVTECLTHKLYVRAATSIGVDEQEATNMLNSYLSAIHNNQPAQYRYTEGDCDDHPLLLFQEI